MWKLWRDFTGYVFMPQTTSLNHRLIPYAGSFVSANFHDVEAKNGVRSEGLSSTKSAYMGANPDCLHRNVPVKYLTSYISPGKQSSPDSDRHQYPMNGTSYGS